MGWKHRGSSSDTVGECQLTHLQMRQRRWQLGGCVIRPDTVSERSADGRWRCSINEAARVRSPLTLSSVTLCGRRLSWSDPIESSVGNALAHFATPTHHERAGCRLEMAAAVQAGRPSDASKGAAAIHGGQGGLDAG